MRIDLIKKFVRHYIEHNGYVMDPEFVNEDDPSQIKSEFVDIGWALDFYTECIKQRTPPISMDDPLSTLRRP